jgi:hypothetical protein
MKRPVASKFTIIAAFLATALVFSPATSVDSATVGKITGTSNSPRQIQFALKYNF